MKPMRLTPAHDIPAGADWVYELKYDGFRAILVWEEDEMRLESRTGKRLNEQFPEVMEQCEQLRDQFAPYLPLTLDGELVFLLSEQQSEFSKVQQRGRLKNKEAIQRQAERFPCHFIAFDLLSCKGKPIVDSPLMEKISCSNYSKKQSSPHQFSLSTLPFCRSFIQIQTLNT